LWLLHSLNSPNNFQKNEIVSKVLKNKREILRRSRKRKISLIPEKLDRRVISIKSFWSGLTVLEIKTCQCLKKFFVKSSSTTVSKLSTAVYNASFEGRHKIIYFNRFVENSTKYVTLVSHWVKINSYELDTVEHVI